ncbi:MAG: hypothetical protein OQK99_08885 [Gammaproteobacteria bacterium]|nr:hypothetical protein [Gammaproteobacteria bacterium]
MYNKAKTAHDAFTFSLGGMRVIASFAVAPAIASNRIIQEQYDPQKSERDTGAEDDCDGESHGWRWKRRLIGQAA